MLKNIKVLIKRLQSKPFLISTAKLEYKTEY